MDTLDECVFRVSYDSFSRISGGIIRISSVLPTVFTLWAFPSVWRLDLLLLFYLDTPSKTQAPLLRTM